MKGKWKQIRRNIFGAVAGPIIRTLLGTTKITFEYKERYEGVESSSILCGLHSKGAVACYAFRNRGYWTLVSLSRDGELQNRIYTSFGLRTVRGSTGRGGARATIEAIKLLRNGKETMIIAIDGPRGPLGRVQEGALIMAKKSGAALVPLACSANPRWSINTWDKYMVPKPFSRIYFVYGEPIYVPQEATAEEIETLRLRLEEAIWACEVEANQRSGYQPKPEELRV